MRLTTLLVPACVALQVSAGGWFGGNSKEEASPASVAAEAAADPFAPVAAGEAAATPAEAAGKEAQATPTRAQRVPTVLATPTDWLNGVKPYAWEPYDGLEYKILWNHVVLRPEIFRYEASGVFLLIAFGILFVMLRDANSARAMAWIHVARPSLLDSFAKFTSGKAGAAAAGDGDAASSDAWLTQTSNTVYSSWATGRKHMRGLMFKFDLQPRGVDVIGMLTAFGQSIYDLTYRSEDRLTLSFYLSNTANSDKGIFSLLRKSELNRLREARWDVRAFTSIASIQPKFAAEGQLNDNFSVFTETGSSAETFTGALDKVGLLEWLRGSGEGQEYFESLTLTDLGALSDGIADADLIKPDALKQDRQLNITMTLPKSHKKFDQTLPLLYLGLNLADMLSGPSGSKLLTNQEVSKIVKRREDIVKNITKEYAAEQKEVLEEERRAAKKKADDDKYAAMTAAQQKKYDELKKARTERKTSGKQQQRVAT